MELNVTYTSFFALLRAGLWQREPEGDCFPLQPEVWKRVYMLACKQTVEGIVYDGIMRLPEHYYPPKELLLNWVVRVDAIEKRNKRMNLAVSELYEIFEQNRITAFLVKGQGVASCYDEPLHRVCGDVDWFFPDKQHFNRANRLMAKNGIKVEKQAKFSNAYTWKGFLIEHHCRLLDIDDPFRIPYLHKLLQQEYEHSTSLNLNEQSIRLPSPLLMHLSVNAHILKHLLTSGVGIRHLCDSARVCCAYPHPIESESFRKIYNKLGIERWIQLLNNLLVNHLGMQAEYLPFPLTQKQKSEQMMKDMLQSGNFGMYGGPLFNNADVPRKKRKAYFHWIERMIRYFRYVHYAPSEACWNPVVVVYSHIRNWLDK